MRPLQGRRILVTRRPEQAGSLVEGLAALGASVVEMPLITQAPPEDFAPLDAALARLDGYHWLAFTSANAVAAVAERLERFGSALPPGLRLASVGPSTTAEIADRFNGRRADLEPASQYRAEGLVAAFHALDLAACRILLPVSDRARDTLAEGLRARGASVDVVAAYRTVAPPDARERLERALAEGVDLVTLASPSAVEGLVGARGAGARGLAVAVIGPLTERAARAAGLDVRVVASPSTVQALVAAIRRYFEAVVGAE